MNIVTAHAIKRTGLSLVGIALFIMCLVLYLGHMSGPDPDQNVSLQQAWQEGWLQGYLVLHLLLLAAGVGIWKLQNWARWIGWFWFPLLSLNNLLTEQWFFERIRTESWLQAGMISLFWMFALYPKLGSAAAAAVFSRQRD